MFNRYLIITKSIRQRTRWRNQCLSRCDIRPKRIRIGELSIFRRLLAVTICDLVRRVRGKLHVYLLTGKVNHRKKKHCIYLLRFENVSNKQFHSFKTYLKKVKQCRNIVMIDKITNFLCIMRYFDVKFAK